MIISAINTSHKKVKTASSGTLHFLKVTLKCCWATRAELREEKSRISRDTQRGKHKKEEKKVEGSRKRRRRRSHRSRFLFFSLALIFSCSPLKLSSQSLLFGLCFSSFHVSPPHFLRLADSLATTKTIASVSLSFFFSPLPSNGVNQQNSKSYPEPEAIKLSK